MARSWFRFSAEDEAPLETPQNGTPRSKSPAETLAIATQQEVSVEETRPPARLPVPAPPVESGQFYSFEQIYQSSAVKPPRISYGILKVAAMANSPHLAGMSPEAKRCSLLMALDAAGVEIEDLLQDAVVRQKALNDYEEQQQQKLKDYETAKLEENARIQAELDRVSNQLLSRIQSNLDDVAREQDKFRAWQRAKQQEAQRITEAATFCVPQGAVGSGLAEVLERATFARK
ncbi:MAG TPA: hypothetical protein VKV17_15165 [Bryobacteraceae bacterium]|nr:hypothetical protein [Bryobacteraceae bacterium]